MKFTLPNLTLAGFLSVLLSNAMAGDDTAMSRAERILNTPRPLVIAHRGFSAVAPENTLPAFQLALDAGADLVELDYHHSKDGILTVLHDSTLDRTTDAKAQRGRTNIHVGTLTFPELERLDAGHWFSPRFAGTRLPSLEQAMDLIQKGAPTLIERKGGDAAACIELLRRKQLINEVVVQSFDWEYLADFHRLEPKQALGGLGPWGTYRGRKLTDADKELSPTWVDEAIRVGVKVVVWNRQVNRAAVDYAHQRGLKVWVYTIDEEPVANSLLDAGVDGLITNNTARMWRMLAVRSLSNRPGQ